ncbi:Anaphase-promoting complex subunit 4 [Heracleum sosnowskyi]|uniref:Anaphase-promoting complex subunit 4 n=1 Tax=Heracleum sosnowskyi TaxID=360622 RepID=A0AAD8H9E2_9APIA|nr:Anaphase-promoting complex subunit 4 [Heracleum sosnowskyi]
MESHNLTIDTVKEEKANAMARYRRFRNFKKLLQLFELFVAVTLVSWSSTCLPAVVKLTGDFFLRFFLSVLNPHVVFLIGNAIIVALFFLSRQIGSDAAATNLNDDGIEFSNSVVEIEPPRSIDTARVEIESPPSMEITVEKQIVCVENVASRTECEAVTNAIEKATKEIQKLERTQSERAWRRETPKRELRRSESEVERTVIKSRETLEKVESLSNEEFRRTVEAFIQKQQNFLRLQKMAEIDTSSISQM